MKIARIEHPSGSRRGVRHECAAPAHCARTALASDPSRRRRALCAAVELPARQPNEARLVAMAPERLDGAIGAGEVRRLRSDGATLSKSAAELLGRELLG
jgi:hypothetical protein